MDWNKGLKTLHGFCMFICFKIKKMKLSFSKDTNVYFRQINEFREKKNNFHVFLLLKAFELCVVIFLLSDCELLYWDTG